MAHRTMDKHYDPKAVEAKWYQRWLDSGAFHGDAARGGEPYCVVIPPPNVTGILHMGHALNNTIQDILVRWRRMQGRNVVWMPGTDHAGIATQNVVERALRKEGKSREDLGREAFVQRVWAWKEEYGNTIISQLKRMGASCDWERTRFTMDAGLSEAVAEVFVRLFDKGLIYRANYIINWCPRCMTALSDEESEHRDTAGHLYYIRYPLAGGARLADGSDHVVVATTRPETLLGDVAVAVNPKDPRYAALHGKTLTLPVLGRALAVVCDDFVDPAFGTGVVKVTPAHDPNDFAMGQRHKLAQVIVMHPDGTMNEEAGPYAGLDRVACRKRIVADLQEQGLIEKVVHHQHAVGHCYRCHTVIEPRLSPQWFVRMQPLAGPAIAAVKSGEVAFVPARWNKVYLDWMENIRDWCISRQIWWGHRIPVFTCTPCGHVWAAKGQPDACPKCGKGELTQDEDVLDTWFSSWLWPFSTFGWPEQNADLKRYYPTHDLVTASEIIFFWVARMVMAGYAFMGQAPFRRVYIHGTVRDDRGLKMSKSLGNSIDPLTIIEQYSADALRFSLMMITATGQDVYVSDEKFEIGRNFGTKLWNAARFMRMHDAEPPLATVTMWSGNTPPPWDPAALRPDDQHLLAALWTGIETCNTNLDECRFNDAALALYEFVWHQYCDWYVEYAKQALYGDDAQRKQTVLAVMHYAFANALRLIHPFMPFISEELWHAMGYGTDAELIMHSAWPVVPAAAACAAAGVDARQVAYVEDKHELIRAGRTLKADYNIPSGKSVNYRLKPADARVARAVRDDAASVQAMLKAESLAVDEGEPPTDTTPSALTKMGTLYMPLAGLVDVAAERGRLNAQLASTIQDLERITLKLSNELFVAKAPGDVVEKQRARRQELLENKEKLSRLLEALTA
ncbi:MAG: valine--tRNA ligase [Verrucomicrobia bacterium]|nr:valine--tRNA ligase [Verrucomicrobiota bacterium]